jgi:geranylgeranyl pyrophosphate synthase
MFEQAITVPRRMLDVRDNLISRLEKLIYSLIYSAGIHATNQPQSSAQQAAIYHLSSGGRRVRARLAIQACSALGVSEDDALCIAAVVELLHNASLVHDDLQDQEKLRHGCVTVWTKFGANVAICTGDLMLSAAYSALCRTSNVQVLPSLLALIHERTASAIEGQCADLAAQTHAMNSTDSYEKIVIAKSGALLSLPLELALTTCGKATWAGEARKAAEAFSIAYQIADDLTDIQQDRLTVGLNILMVLESEGQTINAQDAASRLGLQHLGAAVAAAHRLPCNSGALLLQLSCELREFLTPRNTG